MGDLCWEIKVELNDFSELWQFKKYGFEEEGSNLKGVDG